MKGTPSHSSHTPIVKSILAIASGSALGSLIGLAASPLITRLFSPEEFGVFSVATATAVVLLSLVTGRVELALPIPRADSEARALLALGTAMAFISIALITATAVVWPDLWAVAVSNDVEDHLLTVPALLVPMSAFQLLNAWAIRQARYGAIATRSVLQSTATAAAQLTAGYFALGALGLIGGFLVGQLVGAASMAIGAGLTHHRVTTYTEVVTVARSYRRYPLIMAPSGFVNALGLQAPILVVAATYGVHEAGVVAFAQRVLAAPAFMVGQSVAQVFTGELTRGLRDGEEAALLGLFWRTTRLLTYGGCILAFVGGPIAYLTFGRIFGASWAQAGTVAAVLAFGVAAQVVGSSVSQTLSVFRRFWTVAIWDAVRLASFASSILICWRLGGSLLAATVGLSLVMMLLYALYWWLSFRTLAANVSADGGGAP